MATPWDDLDAFRAAIRSTGLVRRLFEIARDEDLAPDLVDVTAGATVRAGDAWARVQLAIRARRGGVLAGLSLAEDLIEAYGTAAAGARVEAAAVDGAVLEPGAVAGHVLGPAASVLVIERPLLNLLGRLGGVATLTAEYVAAAEAGAREAGVTPPGVFDTRKTTPGLRMLEKYAVRCGGGRSHRLGLHDALLIKDNHIAGVPDDELGERIAAIVRAAENRSLPPDAFGPRPRFVMAEVDRLEQCERLLALDPCPVGIILLDNMSPADLRTAAAMRGNGPVLLEASGGVSPETIGAIAASGVDRVSVGALTHSATAVDFGLDAELG